MWARHVPSNLEGGACASCKRAGLPTTAATTVTSQCTASCPRPLFVREASSKRAKHTDADSYPHPRLHGHTHSTLYEESLPPGVHAISKVDSAVALPPPRKILKLTTALIEATPRPRVHTDSRASSTPTLRRVQCRQASTTTNDDLLQRPRTIGAGVDWAERRNAVQW